MEKKQYLATDELSESKIGVNAMQMMQHLQGRKLQLNQQSHLFIVIMGMLIGTILALFVGYHLNSTVAHFVLLLSLPVILTYVLRKIYIHTLVHTEDDAFDFI